MKLQFNGHSYKCQIYKNAHIELKFVLGLSSMSAEGC